MSLENQFPLVVGFDGLHRAGKGTQIQMLEDSIQAENRSVISVRGDGTREGLGGSKGDPVSPEWQERSSRLKSYDRTVESWNLASYLLLKELHDIKNAADAPDVILVDRTVVSRASFLLHRGAINTNRRATLEELYPDAIDSFSIGDTIPSLIFDLQVRSPDVLLRRLDINDPKYSFRAENIRGGFDAARLASSFLPEHIESRVEKIDAGHEPEVIHDYIKRLIGFRALNSN